MRNCRRRVQQLVLAPLVVAADRSRRPAEVARIEIESSS
jgi:hypothetical protein